MDDLIALFPSLKMNLFLFGKSFLLGGRIRIPNLVYMLHTTNIYW